LKINPEGRDMDLLRNPHPGEIPYPRAILASSA
jgi:hypothetical protein